MEAPIIMLSNGLRVANFSSPHPFTFVDGCILPACDAQRCGRLSLRAIENTKSTMINEISFTDIKLSFELDFNCLHELDRLESNEDVDIVLVPLPVLTALANVPESFSKVRCIRVHDRFTKEIEIDRFCI